MTAAQKSQRAADALRGAGDLMIALRLMIDRELPDTTAGAEECELLFREFGEGFRDVWKDPKAEHYLRQIVYGAQAMVRAFHEHQREKLAESLVRDCDDQELDRYLRLAMREAHERRQPKQS